MRFCVRAGACLVGVVGVVGVVACHGPPPVVALEPPPTLGVGFVDLTTPFGAPFFVHPGDSAGALPEVTVGSFADVDGDGATDVVLSPSGGLPGRLAVVYSWNDATAQLRPRPDIALPPGAPIVAALDLDGDGVTDLLTKAEVAWGEGAGVFAYPAVLVPDAASTFRFDALALVDLDADGWLDVLAGSGRCCPGCADLHPLLRVGARTFVDRPDLVQDAVPVRAWAVVAAPLGPGELVIAALGLPCPGPVGPVFYEAAGRGADELPRFAPKADLVAPGSYAGGSVGVNAPMGAAVGDLNGDGRPELALSFDSDHKLYTGRDAFPLGDATGRTGFGRVASATGDDMIPWAVAFVDVDRDGRDDVVTAHGNDFDGAVSAATPQHATLHWNGGRLRFADLTALSGLSRPGQWRSLSVGDLDADGAADLIVGGEGETPRVYHNVIATGNHGFALRLAGTTSNHLGIGARVEVLVADGGPVQHHLAIGPFSPQAVSEPLVFVGTGSALAAARVTITWPSGVVQELLDVPTGGVVTVVEPRLFALEPAGRHLPADGQSVAAVRVTPHALDGSVRAAAEVRAELHGPGQLVGPIRDGDGWLVQLVAPATPGSTVIAVTVDGVPVGVRPRIWWD